MLVRIPLAGRELRTLGRRLVPVRSILNIDSVRPPPTLVAVCLNNQNVFETPATDTSRLTMPTCADARELEGRKAL